MKSMYFQGIETTYPANSYYDITNNIYFTLSALGGKTVTTAYKPGTKVPSATSTTTSVVLFKDCGEKSYYNTNSETFSRRRQLSAVQETTTTAADKGAARAEEKMETMPHMLQHQHRGLAGDDDAPSYNFCDDTAPACRRNGGGAAACFVVSFILALALIVLQFIRAFHTDSRVVSWVPSDSRVISWATIVLHVIVMILTASSAIVLSNTCVQDYYVELLKNNKESGQGATISLKDGPVMTTVIIASVLSFIQVAINIYFRYKTPPLATEIVGDNIEAVNNDKA